MSGVPIQRKSPLPTCGKCGYPARGIESLTCPECGADLREVGIVKPGQGQGQGTLVFVLLVYSISFMILCGMLSDVVDQYVPWYANASARLSLTPTQGDYEAQLWIETSETVWGNHHYPHGSLGFNLISSSHNGSKPIQITMTGLTPKVEIKTLTLAIDLDKIPPGASFRPEIRLDPDTAIATWQGLDGKSHTSTGPFTDQDVLRFLGDAGLAVNQPQTIADAQQLHLLLDGILQQNNQFTITGFDSYSAGGGSGSGGEPGWVWGVYTLLCTVLWVLGLILIAKRFNRRTSTQTKS